ncbi:hypothetical protein [Sphingomonas sp. SRS2]|uniref:hypothetical protein n=1 Tax=Sphingomonas sp. SRS2 TaxID=133190 RepID=UPI00061846FD|nr:hypothetical protein [Sphingomonas sp. SRS2]KKC27153.1 hypothetical protein WP12_05040 [Sphingomonas sp. SRS2]
MAYLDFSSLAGETRGGSAADAGSFSSTELRVIDFAERVDASREIDHRGRFGRFVEWALGIRLARPLADNRLESLRRFASRARHHPRDIGAEDISRFVDAGFSRGQAYGLLAYLGGRARPTLH